MTSWYSENDCVNVDHLPPFWFILLGILLQSVWSAIMFNSGPTNYCILKWLKNALAIYTFVSVIYLEIMDIITFSQWKSKNINEENSILSGWHHFLCLGSILFTSSNAKTCITTMVTTFFVPASIANIAGNRNYERLSYDASLDSMGILQWAALSVICLWNGLLAVFLIAMVFPAILVCVIACFVSVIAFCWRRCECCKKTVAMVGIVFVWLFFVIVALYATLGMVNLYGNHIPGSSYWPIEWKVFIWPFLERDWNTYMLWVNEEIYGLMDFIFWLL